MKLWSKVYATVWKGVVTLNVTSVNRTQDGILYELSLCNDNHKVAVIVRKERRTIKVSRISRLNSNVITREDLLSSTFHASKEAALRYVCRAAINDCDTRILELRARRANIMESLKSYRKHHD